MSETTTSPDEKRVADTLATFWWLPLLRGILLVVLGCYALFRPGMTAATLAQVVGVFVILDGIFAILAGLLGEVPSRGWTVARGVLELLVGAFIVGYPALVAGATATALLYLIAFAVILSGILEIAAAIQDRKVLEGEGWLMLGGALAILFGILLLVAPLTFGQLIVRVLGGYAILNGIALVGFAFRLRDMPMSLAKRLG